MRLVWRLMAVMTPAPRGSFIAPLWRSPVLLDVIGSTKVHFFWAFSPGLGDSPTLLT